MPTPDRCARCDCGDEIAALKERAEKAEAERDWAVGNLKAEQVANRIARAELEAARDEDQEACRVVMAERDDWKARALSAEQVCDELHAKLDDHGATILRLSADGGDLRSDRDSLRAERDALSARLNSTDSNGFTLEQRAHDDAKQSKALRARVAALEARVVRLKQRSERHGRAGSKP